MLLGKQAIDDDHGQTGQMLAALWDRPQATFASQLEIDGARSRPSRARSTRASRSIEVDLPAVVTTDLRLNQPRYVKLPEILKAKTKPLAVLPLASLGVDTQRAVRRRARPSRRRRARKGIRVKDAARARQPCCAQRGVL